MLFRLGGALYRFRKSTLLIFFLLVIAAGWYGIKVFDTVRSMGMTDPNSESERAQTLIQKNFPRQSSDIILLLSNSSLQVTDEPYQQAAQSLISTLKQRSEIESLTSYYDSQSAALVSKDQHETLIILELKNANSKTDYQHLQPFFHAEPLHVDVGGNMVANIQFDEQLTHDLESSEIIGLPIVAFMLIIIFGGVVAALLPLVIGGVVVVGAFAIVRALASFMTVSSFATNVITIIGLGLAIDYSLFIITRFREELTNDNLSVREALERTMATAGRTILFSGLTVTISLAALLLFPQVMLRSIGLAIMAVALTAMLASLTVLPALLAVMGARVNALSLQRLVRRRAKRETSEPGAWYRLTYWVMRWCIPIILIALGLLLFLGSPFLHARFALPDGDSLPEGASSRTVADHLTHDFADQNNMTITIVAQTHGSVLSSANLARLDQYVRDIKALGHVKSVQSLVSIDPRLSLEQYQQLYAHPEINPALQTAATQLAHKDLTRLTVSATLDAHSGAAHDLVKQVRALHTPAGFSVLVGGLAASEIDQFNGLAAVIPSALAVMIGAIILLLFLMTGSLIMPIKAVILNTLSLSATFGTLVWVFQDGHFQQLLNFQANGYIDAVQPVLIFAIAFGLSMDYEVFLLSRIKEQFDKTGDNRESVAVGLQRTGWLITSAALLLAAVVATFATSKIVYVKEIGLGIALAIIMDATVVRGLLVPAMMRLLGAWNWWAPRPLRWVWERVGLRESDGIEEEPLNKTEPEEAVVGASSSS